MTSATALSVKPKNSDNAQPKKASRKRLTIRCRFE
jgi:hypothetical protein